MSALPRIAVPLYYDLASSLCYVAHRVLGRMEGELADLGIELRWRALDLASLLGWRRGGRVPEIRRENAQRVAEELGVPVQIPPRWLDSRSVNAAALLLEGGIHDLSWRERAFSGVFEGGLDPAARGRVESWSRDLGIELDSERLAEAALSLEVRTRAAAEEGVTGVPTLLLGSWPLGGIQEEFTMRSILTRFADRERRREASGTAQ